MKKITKAALVFVLCFAIAGWSLGLYCSDIFGDISSNVVRLHIIANSDSQEDQSLKLKVRDSIAGAVCDITRDCTNATESLEAIMSNKEKLESVAEQCIKEGDFDYNVKVNVCKTYFPTRDYGDISLPAGEYYATQIIIGEGKGHNWWCVLFPPLCYVNANAVNENTVSDMLPSQAGDTITKSSGSVKIKFKLVEVFERSKQAVSTVLSKIFG